MSATSNGDFVAGFMAFIVIVILMSLVASIVTIIGLWKMFEKAKQPGWAALIPFYNIWIMIQMAGRPWWFMLLYFSSVVPFVGTIVALVVNCIVANDISKAFGREIGTTLGLLFIPVVFYPILGFGEAKFKQPKLKAGFEMS